MRKIYIATLIITAVLCQGCASRGISQRDAITAAEQRAITMKLPIQERSPEITMTEESYIVAYAPKTNARSGSWIFAIDKKTGDIKDVKIWR